jgi:hypothetical protein
MSESTGQIKMYKNRIVRVDGRVRVKADRVQNFRAGPGPGLLILLIKFSYPSQIVAPKILHALFRLLYRRLAHLTHFSSNLDRDLIVIQLELTLS